MSAHESLIIFSVNESLSIDVTYINECEFIGESLNIEILSVHERLAVERLTAHESRYRDTLKYTLYADSFAKEQLIY